MKESLKNFLKGFGLLFIITGSFTALEKVSPGYELVVRLISWLSGVIYISHYQTKYKLSSNWSTASVAFSWLLLPFIWSTEKNKKKKIN